MTDERNWIIRWHRRANSDGWFWKDWTGFLFLCLEYLAVGLVAVIVGLILILMGWVEV